MKSFPQFRSALFLAGVVLSTALRATGAEADAEALFVRRVLPLFQEKCLACHGHDEKKIKGGFDLRTPAGLRMGGDSEQAAVVPGEPEKSPLYLAITRLSSDWEPMPPKENDKLAAEQVSWIKQWIAAGAPWPDEARMKEIAKANAGKWSAEDGVLVPTSGGLSAEWTNRRYKPENLWAYQPLRKPAVPADYGARTNPIDAFLTAKMPDGLAPALPADRRTLLRRATFDLLGLPPSPEEVEAFVNDPAADAAAFAKVVERLLASPHYGERWGRHWLDVVRYADSSGYANDYERGNTWRYRDYVIRAFNADKPYDAFIREQIAGDEIAAAKSSNDPELLIATGFLRMGPWELTSMEVPKVARQRFLDDVTDSVGQVFLAHPLNCARCHDHKFDPVPARDYYAVQACFATTQIVERTAPFLAQENTGGFDERQYLEKRRAEHLVVLRQLDEKSLAAVEAWGKGRDFDRGAFDQAVAQARKSEGDARRGFGGAFNGARNALMKKGVPEDRLPPRHLGFSTADFGLDRMARKGLERLQWEFDRYEPVAFCVYSGVTPDVKSVYAPVRMPKDRLTAGELEQVAILAGGDPFSPGQKVEPGTLSAVAGMRNAARGARSVDQARVPDSAFHIPNSIEGRRRALAEWTASPENPLTARVMVNRIWLWHFGHALAGNPNNFGATGRKPTHPELLDWLAATFIEQGWSVKAMHRLILSSEAYRRGEPVLSGDGSVAAQKTEHWALSTEHYAAFRPRRLSAEELRDSMLAVSGELNRALGGIPARPEINLEAALQPRQVMGTFAAAWEPSPKPEQRHRRSVYALKIRGLRDPFMEVFNEPSPEISCEERDASTVTPQVFSLFNSEASYDRALAFAARVKKEAKTREEAIVRAYALAYGREPQWSEVHACVAHWDAMVARHRTLTFAKPEPPKEVVREAVEENTGEKFTFAESLNRYRDFVPDLKPADVDAETRALAEVCLVLFNSNEFSYVY
jgi:mono/diheme cytochrome c family protein